MKKYFISSKMINYQNEEVIGYLAQDRASGGVTYFSDNINNSEVRTFSSIDEAKTFIKDEYVIENKKLKFKGCGSDKLIGLPEVVTIKNVIEAVYTLV